MAKNYSISEAVAIIVEGQDLEAIQDLGRRYPLLVAKVAVVGALAGEKFVELMSFMPEHVSANKVNTAIKSDIQETDTDEDEATEEKTPKAGKAKVKETDDAEQDYNSMNGDTLIKLCKERGISTKGLKKADLVRVLEEYDANGGTQDSEDDDTETSYEGMKAMDLFKLCKKRGLKAEPKKPAKYYIDLLTADDNADDEGEDDGWEEEEEEKKPAKKEKPKAKPKKEEEDNEDDEWDI